ncbi:MAG: thiol:disulfide interchange protein DsbA/DsbL [Granulosicoccus sp.]
MNKRDFIKSGMALSAAAIAAPYASSALAQAKKNYELIDPPLNTRVSDKVEVIEYFWFGCPHCFSFEPAINAWKDNKPDYVEFVREAPPLNPSWEAHSRAFYASELMGVSDQFFEPMFNAIHVDRRALRSPKQIVKFVGELGIDADKFGKTMDSFATNTKINQAMQMAAGAGLTGVPSIVINGKFRTGASLAGSHEGIINVINELSASEHELMKAG